MATISFFATYANALAKYCLSSLSIRGVKLDVITVKNVGF